MYQALQTVHSYWAYLVVLVLTLATFNAIIKTLGKKYFGPQDFRISLFTLIVSHMQLLIGLIIYFVSPYFSAFSEVGMKGVMNDSVLRLYLIEHPLTMIIAIVLITVGYSKHKNKLVSNKKFRTIAIFYSLALLLILSRIPWNAWF
jgi:heme A synthase